MRGPARPSRLRRPARTRAAAAVAGAASLAAVAAVATTGLASATAQPTHRHQHVKPTIVLVHGAFADASGWSAEIAHFQREGYTVIAPANPLRGLASDAAYLHSVLVTITGPVVLVGHSYGGAVITDAVQGDRNVKALVYISAFLPQRGEAAAFFTDRANYPGSLLSQSTLLFRGTTNPAAGGADQDVYINPADFRAVFAGDQSPRRAAVMAAEQRPVSLFAYTEQAAAPAWATIPSWDLVSLDDKAIPPAAQQFMARRAHAHTVGIHSAHDSLLSHPHAVDDLITSAARSIS